MIKMSKMALEMLAKKPNESNETNMEWEEK